MTGIADNWKVFGGQPLEDTIFNLRFIADDRDVTVNKILRGKNYSNEESFAGALEAAIVKFNAQGLKSYINLNPISLNFDRRACRDVDIKKREKVLIDIDPTSDIRQPATQEEVNQALEIGRDIEKWLAHEGWPKPTIIDSGNGIHLLYHLEDVPNTSKARDLIKKLLHQLNHLFSNNNHKIDTTVSNAGRITKLIGTKAYKGEATEERPVRTSRLLQGHDGRVTYEDLKTLCSGFDSKEPAVKRDISEVHPSVVDSSFGIDGLPPKPLFVKSLEQRRSDLRNALVHLSPDAKHGEGKFEHDAYWSAAILSIASEGEEFRDIAREWSSKGRSFSEDAFNKCWDSYDPNATGYEGKRKTIASLYYYVQQITGKTIRRSGETSKFGQLGDIANGERFAKQFSGQILFVRDSDDAYVFNEKRGWEKADSDAQMKAAKLIATEMGKTAIKWKQDEPDSKAAQAAITEAIRTSKRQGLEAMVWSARSVEGMSVNANQLDADPNLLGVGNGILNLDTGELLQPDPEILVTKRVNVIYDPDALAPRYEQFLQECIPKHEESEFYMRWCGYRMSGFTTEQKFLFSKGNGSNGKSKDLELSLHLLGDYAAKIKTEVLVSAERNPQGHDADLLAFQGVRFAYCNETSEGKYLNEQQVKELVDEGTLTGRAVYGKRHISFPITHTIQMAGNHAPIVRGTDDGIWRRIIVFNWPVKFHDRNDPHPEGFNGPWRDNDLLDKLKAEGSGILNIWLKGYQDWKKEGLMVPESLQTATNVFRDDNDLLGQWIEDECDLGGGYSEPRKDLYRNYDRWCENNGYHKFSSGSFSRSLRERGFTVASDKRTIKGIKIK